MNSSYDLYAIAYDRSATHKAVRPGARPHVLPVMAEGDFRLMTPLYDNLQYKLQQRQSLNTVYLYTKFIHKQHILHNTHTL